MRSLLPFRQVRGTGRVQPIPASATPAGDAWQRSNFLTIARWTIVLLGLVLTPVCEGQTFVSRGRSTVELSLGLWLQTSAGATVSPSGLVTTAQANGLVASLGFQHWLTEQFAAGFWGGVINGTVLSSVAPGEVLQTAAGVVTLFGSARYDVLEIDLGSGLRPFVAAGPGLLVGFEAANSLLSQESHTETAASVRGGAGVDGFFGDRFKLGVYAGYMWADDFPRPVGARTNFSTPEVVVTVGVILGNTREGATRKQAE